ncbi:cell adhesion molecule Dscam1-like isoform X1 [Tachypleus tridentatus]|uniref:cell adhesion molecule Dscam1-like isoform X1 n=1 Tax=Tachypleus tridentatus TaxID=6853 RepID=UPI003FD41275
MMFSRTFWIAIWIGLLTLEDCESCRKNNVHGNHDNKDSSYNCGREVDQQPVAANKHGGLRHLLNASEIYKKDQKRTCSSFSWNTVDVSGFLSLLCVHQTKKDSVHQLSLRFRRQVRDESKTVVSGQTAVLTCSPNGQKVENVVWSKDGLTLPVNPRQSILGNGSLSIREATKPFDEGPYNCRYRDDRFRIRNNVVTLRVSESPAISAFQFPPDLVVGMRVKVMCFVILGDPPFLLQWLKDGSTLSPSYGLSVQYFRDYSILSTENLLPRHSGNYTCSVNNGAGSASYSALLTVNVPPSWIVEPQNSEVAQGKSVRIDCSADGSPTPTITWRKATKDKPADYTPVYNSHKYTLLPNGSLLAHSAGKSEEGYYLCEARNGYGGNLNKLINLTVHLPPKFDIKFKSQSVQTGQSAELSCSATGNQPIKFVWKKDNHFLTNSSRHQLTVLEVPHSNQLSTLRIMRTNRNDSGIYYCLARNDYGQDVMKIQMLIQEAPSPMSNISVTNVTGRTISLAWVEPYNGNSDISWYLIKYRKKTAGQQQESLGNTTVDGSQRVAVLSGLEPATTYLLSITAKNSVAWSTQSKWIEVDTEEEVPSAPPLDVSAQATGPNSIKVMWKPPRQAHWNGRIIGYYIGYRPAKETMYSYKSFDVKHVAEQEQFHLTNLQRSTIYYITIHAFNGKGLGPKSDEIEVKTLDDVPPSAPHLEMLSKSSSSVTLKWSQRTTFGTSVVDYTLHYREENDPSGWIVVPIATHQNQYIVPKLKCGATYQFFMTSHNSVGRSEPSNKLKIRTTGAAPISPTREDFITVNTTSAYLNFSKWQDGGCSINSYTVKLRQKFRSHWRTLAEDLQFNSGSPFPIQSLSVATWYELLVIVQSSAGATEAMYDFRTNNKTKETVFRGTVETPKSRASFFIVDLEILIPIAVSSFVVVVVIVVGCVLCIREARTRRWRNENQVYGKSTQDTVQMKEIGSSPALDYVSSEEGTQRSSAYYQTASQCPPNQSMFSPRPGRDRRNHTHTPHPTILYQCRHLVTINNNQELLEYALSQEGEETSVPITSTADRMNQRERPYETLVLNPDPTYFRSSHQWDL